MRHYNRLMSFDARFKYATFVISATLVSIFIGEVYLNASELLRKALQ